MPWIDHVTGARDMRAVARLVVVHLRRAQDPPRVVDGDDRTVRRRQQPPVAPGVPPEVGRVGEGLTGGDDLVEERPDGGPVLSGGFSDHHPLMMPVKTTSPPILFARASGRERWFP